MCGLVFLYSGADAADARAKVDAALHQLVHRGPDDAGVVTAGNAIAGHRRLSIIDLVNSRQPMTSPCGRYVLSFNGEIYNYRALRPALERNWSFRTAGDTEVLLAGLVQEGIEFIHRLQGMWAFAFWDNSADTLYLCRDRIGKKPLYYQHSKDELAAASELPALRRLAPAAWCEDPDSSADYFRYGYYLPGYTAYRDVREVLPGHYLVWRPARQPEQYSYWSINPRTAPPGNRPAAAGALRSALREAVEKRLVADVEVGAFLSGGVDSSLIVALLHQSGVHPKTFTIGFREQAFDERAYARQIAERLGTDHYEALLDSWDVSTLLDLLRDNIGQPFIDSSLLPTALVSQLAASQVKVALSGDGADELFGGYQRYHARTLLRWYTRLPVLAQKNIARLLRRIPEPMVHHSRSLIKKAHLFLEIADLDTGRQPYVAPRWYSDAALARLIPDLWTGGHPPPGIPEQSEPDDIERMMLADALVYLPQDILTKVDRASMAHSLETRTPFLDTAVIELAFSLPGGWHRRGVSGKRMLYQACGDLLPDSVWRRRKQGFSVPIHAWFRADLGDRLADRLDSTSLPFAKGYVASMLQEHRAGRRDHGHRLWQIYNYCVWKADADGAPV